LKTFLYIQKS